MSFPVEPTSRLRRGFTLTELLVVIAIIAMLAALASVGVMTAMSRAKATAIKVELDQIDAAMKRYKETYGSYPPCNLAFDESGISATEKQRRLGQLRQHLAMAFPRYSADETRLRNDLTAAGIDLEHVRPDQALVFWLQGFNSDPMSPILSVNSKQIDPSNGSEIGNPQKRTNNFFEFDSTRLIARRIGTTPNNPAPSYFPSGARFTTSTPTGFTYPHWEGGTPPMLYFDPRDYAIPGNTPPEPYQFNTNTTRIFDNAGVATAYWHDRNGNGTYNDPVDISSQETWANPNSFQLIAAGADGKYGEDVPSNTMPRLYPTGTNYDLTSTHADDDNATNFTSKAKLGDDLP